MRPTLVAEQVRDSLSQYLSTTYALADERTRRALEEFLTDPEDGIFRGPYLRVRTPFRAAEDGSWEDLLGWSPRGFTPYRHQAQAWRRLSTLHGPASPTVVTTGTGSGKTEAFLVPVLDHCLREREAGREGVKAVLLYPMNALATDQAQRIGNHLGDPRDARLRRAGVQAGLYIGDRASAEFQQANPRVLTDRGEIRRVRPDILITNYKMLDLLLQRPEDRQLWDGSALAYVVLDEFHTYDGAQGTDVAMLLRRLGSATGLAEPGRPLGAVCPVATSATLGANSADTDAGAMREVAAQVFGAPFPPDAVVTEDRRSAADFTGSTDYTLPFPSPGDIAPLGDPTRDRDAMERLAAAFTGKNGLTPPELGKKLRRHRLTAAVLEILDGRPRTPDEVLEALPRYAYHWGMAVQQNPALAARALARYVALLSVARNPDDPARPLLSIEIHHWVRSVRRVLRGISAARPEFAWYDEWVAADGHRGRPLPASAGAPGTADGPAEEAPALAGDSAPPPAEVFLPAVYCRECGRSGWAALSPESDPPRLETNAAQIWRASVGRAKQRVRYLIAATELQAHQAAFAGDQPRSGPVVMVLEGGAGRLRPLSPQGDFGPPRADGPRALKPLRDAALVLVDLGDDRAAERDRCPACRTDNAVRYLGTGLAALAAAGITQLFTGGELDEAAGEKKTLLFNDSVQDAAHRAGYVASRSYTFSLRSLLAAHIPEDAPVALNDLAADAIADVADNRQAQIAVIPPDLHGIPGVETLLTGRSRGSRATWELIAQRLALGAVLEFGLRSRQGRTLELTRTVAADVPLAEPETVTALVLDLLRTTPGEVALTGPPGSGTDRALFFVRGLLERLRTRGAIRHAWLDPWIREGGAGRWLIWGGRRTGMPAFPRGVSAPAFLLNRPKQGSDDFDVATGRLGWYQDWTRRSLGLRPDAANAFLSRLLPALADAGVLGRHTARDGATTVYGLQPGHVRVRRLPDEALDEASASCPDCSWEQPIDPELADQWHGRPCPRYRCAGRLRTGRDPSGSTRRRDFTDDFYRRMYREAGVYSINTAEHTGILSRGRREEVERRFRDGVRVHYGNPQVLSCTPTLELGIDIGDLSAVVLASLPKTPANYVQRVGRAGRASGNSYLLTLVDRKSRDRYYLEDPRQMISGEIRPPGCYLSAVAILRRQYLAHLLDLVAAGRLTTADDDAPVLPLPRLAAEAFGPNGWLDDLRDAALADGPRLAEEFLALFPSYDEPAGTGVSPQAADELRAFATAGLAAALDGARDAWSHRRQTLQRRLADIDAALDALQTGAEEEQRQARELRAERRGAADLAGAIGRSAAHAAFVDLGLLPNYSLVDATTELEATLVWSEETPRKDRGKAVTRNTDERRAYRNAVSRYERPSRLALTDFAPGNHFYAQGYKHRITGLDVGRPERPAWRWWRVCPACGYVRTELAESDTSACGRCGSAGIGDGGCLHRVLRPRRVFARDRRDDARVRDDSDERERRRYTVVPAVDIPAETVETAWRHTTATFGWEFSRRAVVRHINVGESRADLRADDMFAGQPVRINPYRVCPECGHAADQTGSGQKLLHRPWCALARTSADSSGAEPGGVELLLAHELHTEALRILIPAATAYTEERLATFKAVLLAGIARSYGGDPDHLAIVASSAPERGSGGDGARRHYLVLYDTLSGGTGYLHRLAGPGGLHDVLTRARELVASCPCITENRAACHRCLLRHVDDIEYPRVRRDQALDILAELLGTEDERWSVEPVSTTDEITLVRQLESELEARFRRTLLAWADRDDEVSVRRALTPEGDHDITFRFTAPDGSVHGWRMELQTDLGFTVPDVVFRSLDDDRHRVAVYLDGFRYHASPEHNRAADDTAKRTRLRSELGWQVFQFTWDDVDAWAEPSRQPDEPVWQPYRNTAQKTASDVHRRLHGGDPRDLTRWVWTNPVRTLIGYLADPDPQKWRRRTQSALAGFAAVSATSRALADGPDVGRRVAGALAGERLTGGRGDIQVMATADANGCPLVIALDLRKGQEQAAWTALTVLDDRSQAVAGGDTHRRRWQAWLYWTNLLQFLSEGEGDGVQLTTSLLAGFDPATLAVTGGIGWLDSHRSAQRAGHRSPPGDATAADGAAEPQPQAAVRDPGWDEVADYLVDEPGLAELVERLASLGVPAPEAGYELGVDAWPAELAWPQRRVGVVLAHCPGPDGEPDHDAVSRDAAYAQAGWTVRSASEWPTEELAAAIVQPTGEHPRRRGADEEEQDR